MQHLSLWKELVGELRKELLLSPLEQIKTTHLNVTF
jgi:hypothetical protein